MGACWPWRRRGSPTSLAPPAPCCTPAQSRSPPAAPPCRRLPPQEPQGRVQRPLHSFPRHLLPSRLLHPGPRGGGLRDAAAHGGEGGEQRRVQHAAAQRAAGLPRGAGVAGEGRGRCGRGGRGLHLRRPPRLTQQEVRVGARTRHAKPARGPGFSAGSNALHGAGACLPGPTSHHSRCSARCLPSHAAPLPLTLPSLPRPPPPPAAPRASSSATWPATWTRPPRGCPRSRRTRGAPSAATTAWPPPWPAPPACCARYRAHPSRWARPGGRVAAIPPSPCACVGELVPCRRCLVSRGTGLAVARGCPCHPHPHP